MGGLYVDPGCQERIREALYGGARASIHGRRLRLLGDVVKEFVMEGRSSCRALRVVSFALISCLTCSVRGVRLEPTSALLLPIDVSYRVGNSNYTLDVKENGTVRLFATGMETQHGTSDKETLAAITSLLESEEFQSSLARVEKQDVHFGLNRRKLVALWGRGIADGIEGERHYHPTVMVALDDITQVPGEVVDLLRLLDRVGAESFGSSYTGILGASSP